MGVTETLSASLRAQRGSALRDAVREKAVDVAFDSVGAMIACSQPPGYDFSGDELLILFGRGR